MGCTETKEDIEYEMFVLRLKRDKIRKEKNDLMLRYKMLTGKRYKQNSNKKFGNKDNTSTN